MLGEIDLGLGGLRARVAGAVDPAGMPVWIAGTVAAAVAAGAIVGHGDIKLAVMPLAAAVAVLFARVPAAGFVAILWSVATIADIFGPPEIGLSSLQFAPAEILLGPRSSA